MDNSLCPLPHLPMGLDCVQCPNSEHWNLVLWGVDLSSTPCLTSWTRLIPCLGFPKSGHPEPTRFDQRMGEVVSLEKTEVLFSIILSFFMHCFSMLSIFVKTKMPAKQHAGISSYCIFFHVGTHVHLEGTQDLLSTRKDTCTYVCTTL